MNPIDQTIQSQRSRAFDLQAESGMPLLESLVLLKVVKSVGGVISKRELSAAARQELGFDHTYDVLFLKYIDNMVKVGLLAKYDFKYQLTPSGSSYFDNTRNKISPALRSLAFL